MDDRTKAALKERLDRIEALIRQVQRTPSSSGAGQAMVTTSTGGGGDSEALVTTTSRPLSLLLPPPGPRGFVTTSRAGDDEELVAKDGDGAKAVILQGRHEEASELDPRQVVRLRFARRMAALLQGAPLEDDLAAKKSMKLGLIRRLVVATEFPSPPDARIAAPGNDFLWVPAGLGAQSIAGTTAGRGSQPVDLQPGTLVVRAEALERAGELVMSLCVAAACAQTVRGGGEGAPTMLQAAIMPVTVDRARKMLGSCLKLCFSSDTASGGEDVNALLMQHGAVTSGMGRRRSSAMALQAAAGGHLPEDDEERRGGGGGLGAPKMSMSGSMGGRNTGGALASSPSGLLRRPESFERNLRRYTSFAQAVLTQRRLPSFSIGSVANMAQAMRREAGGASNADDSDSSVGGRGG